MRRTRACLLVAALAAALIGLLPAITAEGDNTPKFALTIDIDGPIGPATAHYVKEALATASERQAEVAILQLNTPGGLVSSMREIIADILASPVPVIGYVSPSGGHAASAGTYILYATHIAAMAPGTNLGAATPVDLGGPIPSLPDGTGDGKNGKDAIPAKDAMAEKATNDAVAFIRSLAELRGRNAEWAEKAVRDAASLSANKALEERVIDLIANDTRGLLDKIDGKTVVLAGGATRQLATKNLTVETIEPGWFLEFLAVITDPNIAVILMLVGVYGLIFEFSNPGAVAPGVIGIIALVLGLYALNTLPIDYAGLALMLLGISFLIVETFNPTFVLGVGGVAAFLLGAGMLIRVEAPGYQVSWPVIGIIAVLAFALSALIGRYLWVGRKLPVRIGAPAMRGMTAQILDWRLNDGHVLADGERWQARSPDNFAAGDAAVVTAMDGLTLEVRRRTASDGESS